MKLALALLSAGLFSSCGAFRTLDRDLVELGKHGVAHIKLVNKTGREGQSVVVIINAETGKVWKKFVVMGSDEVDVPVLAGRYYAAAFEDLNENMDYDLEELGAFRGAADPLQIGGTEPIVEILLVISEETQPETTPADLQKAIEVANANLSYHNVGNVVSLDDERFNPAIGALGMWEPAVFLERELHGFYMLEKYDPERTPVIFVHGIGGTPREFKTMIESMDKELFQAWVLFYPSALELKHLSDGMYDTLNVMQRTFKPKKVLLVAHSMGGLVATAAVERYNDEGAHDYLKHFVTIASPLGGMSSAKLGVEYAPTVMPCWEDLAPGSDFLTSLYFTEKPTVPYTLFFAFRRSGIVSPSGDGTVSLASQLRLEAQARAGQQLIGIDAGHVDVLSHPQTLEELNRLFVEYGSPDTD